jgi:hypothetical protein
VIDTGTLVVARKHGDLHGGEQAKPLLERGQPSNLIERPKVHNRITTQALGTIGEDWAAVDGNDGRPPQVLAYFKKTQLEKTCTGQSVEVQIDTFSKHKFYAHVDNLSPGNEFAAASGRCDRQPHQGRAADSIQDRA